jgi:hypothetical protein
MTVKDLITKLQDCNEDAEINLAMQLSVEEAKPFLVTSMVDHLAVGEKSIYLHSNVIPKDGILHRV